MTNLLLLLALVNVNAAPAPEQQQYSAADYAQVRLKSVVDQQERLLIYVRLAPLDPIKSSPIHREWKYRYQISGMGRIGTSAQFAQRVRVFAENRNPQKLDDITFDVTRMLMRLWDYNVQILGIDHATETGRTVDVYLSSLGRAGGEHLITRDPETPNIDGQPGLVNTVHIYDLPSFTNALERAREVAHEYGHATLPRIFGYSAPESFANGDVGERLYLKWLREDMEKGTIGWLDTTGAKKEEIDAYLARRVTPLVQRIAENGPNLTILNGTDQNAFMEYVALVMYAEAVLPRNAFVRFMRLTGDGHGRQAGRELPNVVSERPDLAFRLEGPLRGKPIWIPIGNARLTAGRQLERKGQWAKVAPDAQGRINTRGNPN